ncbi:MAG: DNA polymerase III subunit gamma/tau, partial [Chlamydiae bacterium]|nr:DNA polymerase III subunit gamma/tau [Chlamydiota bacterium]
RLFAKAINCQERGPDLEPCNQCSSCLEINAGQSLDVIEIDGASNRGIDDIRQINETALYSPTQGRTKIYLIDEVHMLTKEAFNALLKTLEEPPAQIKFFFATTEPHKVPPTIISRCQRFDLRRMPIDQIIKKLHRIAQDLGRKTDPAALHLIASFADGSLRDAESLFDQILVFTEETITEASIRDAFGLIPKELFYALDLAFLEERFSFAFELVENLLSLGKDLSHFYEELIDHVRTFTKTQFTKETDPSTKTYTPAQSLYLLEYLLKNESSFQKSVSQRASLEMILLHYLQSKKRIPLELLVQRLTALEQRLKGEKIVEVVEKLPEKRKESVEVVLPSSPPNSPPQLKPVPFNPYQTPPPIQELPPTQPSVQNDRSRYDTLIRFAAVELEGTLKL